MEGITSSSGGVGEKEWEKGSELRFGGRRCGGEGKGEYVG